MREFKMYVGAAFMESMRVHLSGTPEEKEALYERGERARNSRIESFRIEFIALWGDDMWRFVNRIMTSRWNNGYWLNALTTPRRIHMWTWSANPDNDYDDSELGIEFKDGRFLYTHTTPTGGYGDIITVMRSDLSMSEVEEYCRVRPTPAIHTFET